MPAKKYHGGRALLNKPGFESTAALVAEILDTSKEFDEDQQWTSIQFHLSDCNRSVSLSFSLFTADERANSLFKARKIADLTAKFLEGIEREAALAAQREKDRKAGR